MIKYNKLALLLLLMCTTIGVWAQSNGSNSSYSRFGLGTLNDQSSGFNRGMGGISLGLRNGNKVNMTNPASYSSIDSLSFLFDVSMNASFGNLKSGGNSVNVKNCSLSNVNAGLRLRKGLGLSFGFVPYSTIGYNFYTENKVTNELTTTQPISTQNTYYGDGGVHQMYIGVGWKVFKDLSIGANIAYLWGNYNHTMSQVFYEGESQSSNFSGQNMTYDADIKTYKLDVGLQYPIRITKEDMLTIGATAGIGHKIKSEATMTRYTSTNDTLQLATDDAFDLPYTFGIGAAWEHQNKWLAGIDVTYEKWEDCHVAKATDTNGVLTYSPQKGEYKNRLKIAAGAQYTPNPADRRYLQRVQYRIGANYSTPYLKVNGVDGPKEYGISAGVGLPITNAYNNRSVVNVNLQWLRRAPSISSLITENYLMLNIGITFNEMWFMKFKIK